MFFDRLTGGAGGTDLRVESKESRGLASRETEGATGGGKLRIGGVFELIGGGKLRMTGGLGAGVSGPETAMLGGGGGGGACDLGCGMEADT